MRGDRKVMSPPLKVKYKKILKFPATEFVFAFYKFSSNLVFICCGHKYFKAQESQCIKNSKTRYYSHEHDLQTHQTASIPPRPPPPPLGLVNQLQGGPEIRVMPLYLSMTDYSWAKHKKCTCLFF